MSKQLVIPMSGTGARFIAAGYATPKPFITIAGKTIVQHILEMYPGWEDILFIVNSDHFKDKDLNLEQKLLAFAPTAKIHIVSPHKLGPSHSVQEAKDSLMDDGPIVINYCDFAGKFDLNEFEEKIFEYDSVLLTYSGFHPHMLRSSKFAYLKRDGEEFTDIQEKQSYTSTPMLEEASAGAYSFKNKQLLLESIDTQISSGFNLNGELYTSLTVKALLKNGGKVGSTLMSKFFQWGTPEDLKDFNYWINSINAITESEQYGQAKENHVVLLAGGKGSRIANGKNQPKPLLPVAGRHLWEEAFKARNSLSINHLVVRNELSFHFDKDLFRSTIELTFETRGQADSTLMALNSITDDFPLSVLASDCILPQSIVSKATKLIEECDYDLVVWTSENYPPSLLDANSFSWVTGDNLVSSISLKSLPETVDGTLRLITGNFTFRNAALAKMLIDKLMRDETRMVNSEFYLDSTLVVALELGLKVGILEVPHFISLGTIVELETFQYWSECTSGFSNE